MEDIKFPSLAATEKPFTKPQQADTNLYPESFADKLFKDEKGNMKVTCIKALFGVIAGIFSGGILLFLLRFSFSYELYLAGYISIGWAVLSCIVLSISVHARCTYLLMIPSLFTGRGQVAILAVIFGLLLSRPIHNISQNAGEVSRSMACSTELFHNQSVSLRQQLKIPVEQIKAALSEQVEDVKEMGETIKNAVKPIYEAINAVKNGLHKISGALDTASQECDRILGVVYDDCVRELNKAYSKCETALGKAKKYVRWLDVTPICKVLDIDEVCVVVKPDFICSPVKSLDAAAEYLAEKAAGLANGINKWFQFEITKKSKFDNVYNSTKTAKQLIMEVQAALTERQITMTLAVGILNKLLALSLLLLLVQSFVYLKHYLAQDDFDNIYITKKFKEYDQMSQENGQPSIFPLTKVEKKMYIDRNTPKMATNEIKECFVGIAFVLLHMLLSACVVFLNYVLYYILYLVNRYGHVNVEFTGQSKINLKVKGGQMAAFINTFLNKISIENTYETTYNTTTCLPNPAAPDGTDIPILLAAYSAAMIMVFLKAYGSRFNRKICALYYGEQENVRVMYLRNKILYNRKKRKTFMKQNVASMRRQKITEEKLSFRQILASITPGVESPPSPAQTGNYCMNCGRNASSFVPLEKCKNSSCDAKYCSECFNEFNQICPLCSK